MAPPQPVRIAHAYGNSRTALRRALAADVDMIEADVWYRGGDVYVHHARRLSPLPLLADKEMPGHPLPRPAFPVWPGYRVWPHINPLKLDELLQIVGGAKRLLLDVKGRYKGGRSADFAGAIARRLREHQASSWTAVCGQTYPVLNALRRTDDEIEVRYSLEKPPQWESFVRKMKKHERVRQVCISQHFLDDEKARVLEQNGVDVYVWTIDDPEAARRSVEQGADGIISNDLDLLESLPRR
ncbi:MAG: glycerophosphodiester phosphodiesterase [Chloroflexi bacterium]|nr:glycerophosphodiester phosphodiesterase [Chloroflexota bacterium]